MTLRTPLYDRHVSAGGKMVDFAGYELPIQYQTSLVTEHLAVRTKAGLFDVSHMGEFILEGPNALAQLNYWLTNSYDSLAVGRVRYALMCNEAGGALDDLIVYRLQDERYLIVVNAANRAKDWQWMNDHLLADVHFSDISDNTALLALQGPRSKDIITKLVAPELLPQKYYSVVTGVGIAGMTTMIAQTGYTGEFGYEIFVDNADAPRLWDLLMAAGADFGLIPAGLGARDTLRLEAGMPLYGHEMDETVTPLEAGLAFGVDLGKPDFIGKQGIQAKLPLSRVRVGLEVTGRGIIREHADIYAGDRLIGQSTSGTHAPYLGRPIAMALVAVEYARPGQEVEAEVRGRRIGAKVVPLPFYKREKSTTGSTKEKP